MSSTRLRVVVLGAGHWHAPRYLAGLRALDQQLVGISDADATTAHRLADELGVPADTDGVTLVERLRPDLVVAMATHAAMPAQTVALLSFDIGLVLEKPLGRNADEVAPLVAAVQQHKRFAAVALINRYAQFWVQLHRLHDAGQLGPVMHAHFRVVNGLPARYRRDGVDWMLDPTISGGGALRNLGIHSTDAVCQLAGTSEVRVIGAAVSQAHYKEPVEEFATAIIEAPNGMIATMEAGYTFATMESGGDAESRVMAGNASLISRDRRLFMRTLDDTETWSVAEDPSDRLYQRFLADSLARFRRGEPPIASIADCWHAQRVIDSIYAAATPGR